MSRILDPHFSILEKNIKLLFGFAERWASPNSLLTNIISTNYKCRIIQPAKPVPNVILLTVYTLVVILPNVLPNLKHCVRQNIFVNGLRH